MYVNMILHLLVDIKWLRHIWLIIQLNDSVKAVALNNKPYLFRRECQDEYEKKSESNNNDRLFMVPHLVRAQGVHKGWRMCTFHHTVTQKHEHTCIHSCMHACVPHPHMHTDMHTDNIHRHYKCMHFWWCVCGKVKRLVFSFDLGEWRGMPDSFSLVTLFVFSLLCVCVHEATLISCNRLMTC